MPASQHRENGSIIDTAVVSNGRQEDDACPKATPSTGRHPSPAAATTPLAGAWLRAERSTAASGKEQPPLFPLARVHDKLIIALASNMSGANGDTFMSLAIKEFTDSCREAFEDLSGDHGKMQQLGRRIINYIHTLHTLCRSNAKCLYHVEKLSDLISLYIMCELSYADVFGDSRQSIANRLIFTILKYTEAASEACSKATIRRVFVELHKFFKQDQIVKQLLQRFVLADSCEGCREPRAVYDDDKFIEYLIIFNQGKSLYKDDDEQRRRFIARAGELVQPGASLLTNAAYAAVLPPFTLNGRATEQILKRLYHTKDLRDVYRYENSFGKKVAPHLNPEARQYFEDLMHCLTSAACRADLLKCGFSASRLGPGGVPQIDLTFDDEDDDEEDGGPPVNGATPIEPPTTRAATPATTTATACRAPTSATTTVLAGLSSARMWGSCSSSPSEEIISLTSDDEAEDEDAGRRPVNGRAGGHHCLTNPNPEGERVVACCCGGDCPMTLTPHRREAPMTPTPNRREAPMTLRIAASYSCYMLHQHDGQEGSTNGSPRQNGPESWRVGDEAAAEATAEKAREASQLSSRKAAAAGHSDAALVTPLLMPQTPEKKKVRFSDRHLGPTKRKGSTGRRAIKPIIVGTCGSGGSGGKAATSSPKRRSGSVERVRSPAKMAHVNELPSLFSGYKVRQIDSLVSSTPSPTPPQMPPTTPRLQEVASVEAPASSKAQRPDSVAALFAKIMPRQPAKRVAPPMSACRVVLGKRKMSAAAAVSRAREMSLQKQVVVRNAVAHTNGSGAAAGRCVHEAAAAAAAQPWRRRESMLQQQQQYILLQQQPQHLLQPQPKFSNDTSNTVQSGGQRSPTDNNNTHQRPSPSHHHRPSLSLSHRSNTTTTTRTTTTQTSPHPPPPSPPPPPRHPSTDSGASPKKRRASSGGQALSQRRRRHSRHESADDPTYCAPPGCHVAAAESGGATSTINRTTNRIATTARRPRYKTRSQSGDPGGMPHVVRGIQECRVRLLRCPVATRMARAQLVSDDDEADSSVDEAVAEGDAISATIIGSASERAACVDDDREDEAETARSDQRLPHHCLNHNDHLAQPQLPLFVEQLGGGVDSCDSFSSGNEWWLPTRKIVVQAQINNNNIQHDDNNNKNDGTGDVDEGSDSGRLEATSSAGHDHNGTGDSISETTNITTGATIGDTNNTISNTNSNSDSNTSTSNTNSSINNTNTFTSDINTTICNTNTPISNTSTTISTINTINIISDTTSNTFDTTNTTTIITPNGVVDPTTTTTTTSDLLDNRISTTTVNDICTAIDLSKTASTNTTTPTITTDGFNPTNGTVVTISELLSMPPFAVTHNNSNKKRSNSLPQLPSYDHNSHHHHHNSDMLSDDDVDVDDDDDTDDNPYACGTIGPGLNGLAAGDKEFAAIIRATMNGLSHNTHTAATTTTTSSSSPSSLMATPPHLTPCSTPTPILMRYLLDNATVIQAAAAASSMQHHTSDDGGGEASTSSLLNMMTMEEASPDGPTFLFNGESRHAEPSSAATATTSLASGGRHQHHHHHQHQTEMARSE